jgi:hypothetical protein
MSFIDRLGNLNFMRQASSAPESPPPTIIMSKSIAAVMFIVYLRKTYFARLRDISLTRFHHFYPGLQ